jgi:hypothetical protein
MTMRRVVAVVLAWLALPAVAHADRTFSERFNESTQGDITIAANSLLTCLEDTNGSCANARNAVSGATGLNNNDRTMTWIDADGDPETFNSSAANLTVPTGASVLFAGLYYGGRLTKGTGGTDGDASKQNVVSFKAPGDAGYTELTASQVDTASTQYQGFVEVTERVGRAGSGTYWVADVQLGTGRSDATSGGWALVVAYNDTDEPNRNLSVFDGLQNVGGSDTVEIPLSGVPDPAIAAGELDGRAGRLRGRSRHAR